MTSKGATIDVGAWLRDLGLGQYEAAFRENAINEKVLPNLTAEDLKDMGIGIVGHRRLLLDAIVALHTGADAKLPSRDDASHATIWIRCGRARTRSWQSQSCPRSPSGGLRR
jgi:hypothetical protein